MLVSDADDADDDDMVDNVDDEGKAKTAVLLLLVVAFLEADKGGGLSSALLNSIPFAATTEDDLAHAEIESGVAVVRRLFTEEVALGDGSTGRLRATFKADRRLLGAQDFVIPTDVGGTASIMSGSPDGPDGTG